MTTGFKPTELVNDNNLALIKFIINNNNNNNNKSMPGHSTPRDLQTKTEVAKTVYKLQKGEMT
jgi:hypothetical protein